MKKTFLAVIGVTFLCAAVVFCKGMFHMEAETSFAVFSTPGTHGPRSGMDEHFGDIKVSSVSTSLQNLKIEGNLYLAPTANGGTIRLTNVNVEGAIVVLATEETSIYLCDVSVPKLTINQAIAPVTITTQGSTHIPLLQTRGQVIIEEEHHNGINGLVLKDNTILELSATVNTLTVAGDNTKLLLQNGAITELVVNEGLIGTSIEIGEAGLVDLLELAATAKVTGAGIINEAYLHVADVQLALTPQIISGLEPLTLVEEELVEKPPIIIYRINNVTLEPGKTALVSVETKPNAGRTLTATSANSKLVTATVSQDAISLRALAPGTARVSVLASHPDYSDASVAFTVVVRIPKPIDPPVEESPPEEPPPEEDAPLEETPPEREQPPEEAPLEPEETDSSEQEE